MSAANTPGDSFIEAIAQAVAKHLETWSGTTNRLMELEEAALYLGMSPNALRDKAGIVIPCVRIDSKKRFDRRDLDRFIDRAPREGV